MSDTDCEEILVNKPLCGSKCEMANCKSNANVKKSFFRFPQDDHLCSQWTFACGRLDLVELYLKRGSMFFYNTKKVCEDHFIKSNFRNPALLSQGLFKGVVPTRNLPELKTVLNILSNKHSSKEDEVEDIIELEIIPVPIIIPNTTSVLKRSSRLRKCNQRYSNNSLSSFQPIRINNMKNKSIIQRKIQFRKRGRPKKENNIIIQLD